MESLAGNSSDISVCFSMFRREFDLKRINLYARKD